MNKPSGTVTLLFSDIEGSTRLWEQYPAEMTRALARHDEIVRQAIERKDGHIFKTVGDAFCAVFHNASEALDASADVQLALESEPWPEPIQILVRIGLHAGSVEVRGDDYFGQPVNRVARMLAACHGGQIIISDVVRELSLGNLPNGCTLKPLGEHRFKGLDHPESIYQLCVPGLRADFPVLRSLENIPNNLPQQVTSFVGREREIAEIEGLLSKARLLTLTGSGGCGKTRLSLQVASEMIESFHDGAWLVELAPLADPDLVPQTVAAVFGLKEQANKPIVDILIAHLKPLHLLLILDNCEHLLDACARLCDAIQRSCPQLVILASSREGLGISGEQSYRVPSLSMPDPKRNPTAHDLLPYESVRLFVSRAQFYQPNFDISDQNAPALASICYRLDGIPLAIELAAARIRSMSVEEINQRLDQRFRLLTGGSRTALPRQQTLRSLIDWSYDLLTPTEKALICRLSVFSGGWDLAAAEQVCSDDRVDEYDIVDLLTSLVDKSLVKSEERDGKTRYRLLETVRQYARDRLMESGASEDWRNRHLFYFVTLARHAGAELIDINQIDSLNRIETEHDNFRAALAWACSVPDHADAGLEIGIGIWRFWFVRGYIDEGRKLLSELIESSGGKSTKIRGSALLHLSTLEEGQGTICAKNDHAEQSLSLFREIDDSPGISAALMRLGINAFLHSDYATAQKMLDEALSKRASQSPIVTGTTLQFLGNLSIHRADYSRARRELEESAAIFRELGEMVGLASVLNHLGGCSEDVGVFDTAYEMYNEAQSIRRSLGDTQGLPYSLADLGGIASYKGDLDQAVALMDEALSLFRQTGHRYGIAHALGKYARVSILRGDCPLAKAQLVESLTIRKELAERRGIADSLEGFAELSVATGDASKAAKLWGATEKMREDLGAPLAPAAKTRYAQSYDSAKKMLGEAAFERDWQAGRSMEIDSAIQLALK